MEHSPLPPPLFLLLVYSLLALASLPFVSSDQKTPLRDINLENPTLEFGTTLCQRVHVTGISRLNLKFYASVVRVNLKIDEVTPDRLREKIQICVHRNVSMGLCQCNEEVWESLQHGQWSSVISPYEDRYIDINTDDKMSIALTVSLDEEFQQWRLFFLGLGFVLLLVAPIISSWVPFYYSSSMALGVVLIILILLFQGMKLLPTGRKNILYITIYGSVLGLGSFVAHYFSILVNSLLVSFGLNEELHNPVSVFIVVGIVLAGAALGYWTVRKFVLSDDGSVDAGIAQFVKWAMRLTGVIFVLQSTLDIPLALVSLAVFWNFCSLFNSKIWRHTSKKNGSALQQNTSSHRQAEFLTPTSKKMTRVLWASSSPYTLSSPPIRGKSYSSLAKRAKQQNNHYYSTYHKIPAKKFTKEEWENLTRESTKVALQEWASTPEVAKWIADNANRMRLDQGNSCSTDTTESSSDSSEETIENDSRLSFFKWL
ncbi:uncharacterized protein LOC122023574 isoform X1 [Zingiber officinale]|uniref:uncharacterized protein LOC122023574 isoform X1 n=1 Tax=Zingiber officinale TaxID=94328 RepID=UPI001C4CCDB1|nr:uncharacterized protein LOC122023574 isoform X1 [Zingiber officinale]